MNRLHGENGVENRDPRLDLRYNQLLRECLAALSAYSLIPAEAEGEVIAAASRLCAGKAAAGDIPPLAPDREYYIVWDNGDVPVVRCRGGDILAAFDEVAAVAFQTVFLETDLDGGCRYKG